MILVAGLAVAGLVGIVAAFYFSIRTGGSKKRNSRVRAAGSGRARADRHLGSTPATRDERPVNARRAADDDRTVNAHRGPNSGPNATSGRSPKTARSTNTVWSPDTGQGAAAGTRAEAQRAPQAWQAQREVATVATPAFGAGSAPEVSLDDTPGDAWPGPGPDDSPRPLGGFGPAAPRPGSRSATRMARAAGVDGDEDTAKTAKPRRRMGFRKGADMDEEMWPTESFGGVTDDQFWDDMASDKPLARTARTAQHGSANRSLAADPAAQPHPGPKGPKPGGAWGNTRRTGNSAYPESSPGAAERTAVLPVHGASQPGPVAPASGGTQPVPSLQASTQPTPMAPSQGAPGQGAPGQGAPGRGAPGRGAPGQGRSGQGSQYSRTSSQPMRTDPAPAETNGRRLGAGISASEDPLTSAAFCLRSSGPVDGRSNQVPSGPHDISREREFYPPARNRAAEDRGRPDRPQPSGGWYRSSDSAAIEDYGRPADAHRGAAAYPYPGPPLSAPVAEAPATPPYGLPNGAPYRVPYGYGNGNNAPAPGDGPRRLDPAGEPTRRGGSGYQPPRQGPGEGHPSGGQRRVRDPRDDYQRLVSRR
jgi:hypothetical protein